MHFTVLQLSENILLFYCAAVGFQNTLYQLQERNSPCLGMHFTVLQLSENILLFYCAAVGFQNTLYQLQERNSSYEVSLEVLTP